MSSALEIDGKILHPIKDASQVVSYSRDYVTRLARENKIVAQQVGRQWFIDLDSLKHYIEVAAVEQQVRKRQLSEDRKRERQLRETIEQRRTQQSQQVRTLHVRAAVITTLVLSCGLLTGVAVDQWSLIPSLLNNDSLQHQQPAQVTQRSLSDSDVVARVDYLPADASPAAVSSRHIDSLGAVSEGVLLLPAGQSSSSATSFFSDTVEVRTLADGTQEVVRVDAEGETVGDPVPFVVVPVNSREM